MSQTEKLLLIENDYPELYQAYQLKEQLRLILHLSDRDKAEEAIRIWLQDAETCSLEPFRLLSEKIRRHMENILRAIECQANSAKSEACNTTIKALVKMARGFKNLENLKSLIYLRCSDLVIPLHNRFRMTPQQAKSRREHANQMRAVRLARKAEAYKENA